MKFHIGQDVVCIKNLQTSIVRIKKGDVFTIKALRETPCHCSGIDLDIGAKHNCHTGITCTICGGDETDNSSTAWVSELFFAPLDTLCDISELTEHLETTKPFEA